MLRFKEEVIFNSIAWNPFQELILLLDKVRGKAIKGMPVQQKVLLILVVWYSLVSSRAIYPLLDIVVPSFKNVSGTELFPCASHDCGCETKEQCMTKCCCFPTKEPPKRRLCKSVHDQRNVKVKVSYFSAAKCAGLEDHEEVLMKHLPLYPSVPWLTPVMIQRLAYINDALYEPFLVNNDKIPIV